MWEIVNELTYNKKRCRTVPSKLISKDCTVITNYQTIADEFNKHFVNAGKSMPDLIAPGSLNKSYSNSGVWSSDKASNSIFLYPCSLQEVFFLHCPLFREGCGGSSSRLSRHTSRSSITSIISLGRSP